MTEIDPTAVPPEDLAQMLAAWSEGSLPDEAAVGLLVGGVRGIWLRRRDFLTACVDAVDDGWTRDGVVPMAAVQWLDALTFLQTAPASSGEANVLRCAASLAGHDAGPLIEITASLDVTNLAAVLDAVAHRAGWHERGHTHTVTGLPRQSEATR